MAKGGRRGGYNTNRKRGASVGSELATKSKFVAPTTGHEDVYFTTGSTKDVAGFQGTVQKLARQVSTATGWKQSPILGKATTDLQDLVFKPSSRLIRQYYQYTDGAVTTDWDTAGT